MKIRLEHLVAHIVLLASVAESFNPAIPGSIFSFALGKSSQSLRMCSAGDRAVPAKAPMFLIELSYG